MLHFDKRDKQFCGLLGMLIVIGFIMITLHACTKDANAAVVDFDKRNNPRAPIAVEKVDFVIESDSSDTASITLNGELLQYVLTSEDLSGSSTLTVSVTNESGATLYQKLNIAENSTVFINLTQDETIAIAETNTVTVNATDVQQAGDVSLELYYR